MAIYSSGSEEAEAAMERLRTIGANQCRVMLPAEPGKSTEASSSGDYSRFLLPGERLIAIPPGDVATKDIVECLRHESLPAIFVLPLDGKLIKRSREPFDPLSEDSLVLAVEALGADHGERGQFSAKPNILTKVLGVEQTLQEARRGLIDATRLGHSLTASSAWLLDNTHVFESHFAEVRANLPKQYTRILPALLSRPEELRIYDVAVQIVRHTGCIITQDKLVACLTAYQVTYPLDIAELWTFPLMLRVALLEELARLAVGVGQDQDLREASYLWGNRLAAAGRASAAALDRFLAELSGQPYAGDCHFLAFLGEQLLGEEDALVPVQRWAEERAGESLADLVRSEQHHEAADRVSIANDVTSLRELSRIDFKVIFEAVSPVEAILRDDPFGGHAQQDFLTRDRCRRAVEEISRHSRSSQLEVARQAVELAASATTLHQRQTAYYLIAEGRPILEQRSGNGTPLSLRIVRAARRHPTATYLTLIGGLTGAFSAIAIALAWENGVRNEARLAIFALLALFPLSELALQIVNAMLIALLPPTRLPRLALEDGIPVEHATLVVVPMMLSNDEVVRQEIEKLEIRFLANPEPNVYFSLFSDFTDAAEEVTASDSQLLGLAQAGIEALNQRHGSHRFLHFHRMRTWSDTEQHWIGRERKRGKIEELNEYLCGGDSSIVSVGVLPVSISFVITLDADTQLPAGTARRLVGTIAHPLNRVELAADGRHRQRGYTIIQPRVSISLPNATATRFTRVISDAHGTDPYCQAVSDVYQDLAGEGIFHGKAIYDVRAFHDILGERFPPATLLSHDLIEGAHVGVAFAGDIELFEGMPLDYASFSQRQHRWIRGDWQIARWMLPRVRSVQGGSEANPLPLLDRWRIFDNLRRSLVPAASILFLLFGWLISPAPGVWSLILAVALGVPAAAGLADRVIRRISGEVYGWSGVSEEMLRILVLVAFLPHQAWLAIDAIVRVFYRKLFSRRLLLQWQTAEMAASAMPRHFSRTLLHLMAISAVSMVLMLMLSARDALWPAVLFLGVWLIGPLIMRWLSVPIADGRQGPLSLAQTAFLRRMSRLIWRYFDDHVGAATNWLPPDNSQLALRIEVAQRTSPTNIGLWLTSSLAAVDFGYLTPDEFLSRCGASLDTMQRLERYEGHWLNWYDTQTLEPLVPRYVSTVDSGNLLAAFWVLERGLLELPDAPVPGAACLRGLADTLSVLAEKSGRDPSLRIPVRALRHLFRRGARGHEIIGRLGQAAQPVKQLTAAFRWQATSGGEHAYWVAKLDQQLISWTTAAARYLSWMETLAAPSDEFLRKIHANAVEVRGRALRTVPNLAMLAAGAEQPVEELLLLAGRGAPPSQSAWLRQLAAEYGQARAAARETVGRCQTLAAQVRQLADGIRMGFLYDTRRRLFGIGYSVGGPVEFTSHYDLLASECRIASLASIAKGDVPLEHWLALGRAYITASEGQVLLSWTGTMFEYLMPLLFMRSFENSLLEGACRQAVIRQMEYGREQGAPWGISECAYSVLDSNQVYQYHAFGVPTLALKPGVGDDVVVSPYSSFLALAVFPRAATENLERLAGMGLEGPMGPYEAIDFSRENARGGGRGVIIYTYMAHHQGMSLLAIDNALHRGVMQRRFHKNPSIKAVESLLYERIPPARSVLQQSLPERPAEETIADGAVNFRALQEALQEEGTVPRVHLLGNGNYSVMLTSSGGGYSQWNGAAISRWHADTTLDNWGTYLYIRDTHSGAVWSAAYQPVGGEIGVSNARFSPDRAEFVRRAQGIETLTEICVSPRDDAEVRRITFINRSSRARTLEATSLWELALAQPRADAAHPAFSKMFVQTEYLPEANALIAHRRPRSPGADPIWAAHLLIAPASSTALQFETSREKFLGRGRSHANPAALEGDLTGTAGTVLDPIFSLRCRFALAPRDRAELTFVTLAAASREALVALIEKFRQRDSVNDAFEMGWTNAQLELRFLAIPGAATLAFHELAGHLLFPNSRLRPNAARLARNTLGQEGLWAYGISGDLPILTLTLTDARSLSLVRETLLAHTFWRLRGFKADLVILNQETPSYDQPFHHQLRRLVESHSVHTGIDIPGGVFLRDWHALPEGHRALLLAASHATLAGIRGTLAQQLALSNDPPSSLPLLEPVPPAKPDAAGQLPFLELPYFNGLGGFTSDGREYAIYLDKGARTPAPWSNVIASPHFGTLVTESGLGFTWSGNSQANRLTPWHNDPVRDPQSEILYLRDEESGEFWTPTALPIREESPYRARHGQGYTVYEHHSHGIHQELTVFVDLEENVKLCWLRLRNDSGRPRRLSVTWFAEWVLGTRRDDNQLHIQSTFDAGSNALFAKNPWNQLYASQVAFSTTSPPPDSYSADRTQFLGRNAAHTRPAGMARIRLNGRAEAGLDPVAVLRTPLNLAIGQSGDVTCLLGEAGSDVAARAIIERFRQPEAVPAALEAVRRSWNQRLGVIEVHTPVLSVDFLLNRWLVYQTLSCRFWGRSGFYQSGGAFGFRDQLQDSMALVYSAPDIARQHLLTAAARQFPEGDVQHWWHPDSGAGVRTLCSDDLLWLPYVAAHYIRVTGDAAVLQELVPFIDGPLLQPGEHERISTAIVSPVATTLLDHCERALQKALPTGAHGLPLFGNGDWNDGMNLVGAAGRGESTWLAWFFIDVIREFSPWLAAPQAARFHAAAAQLATAMETQCWDGDWYLRGFFDDGSKLGSHENVEARIDSIPQSWAAICGAGEPGHTSRALESALSYLVPGNDRIIRLFTPPFDHSEPHPGYIMGYPPGLRENGGQYTHAAIWLALAFARLGDGVNCGRLLDLLNPVEQARDEKAVARYALEPYVAAADIYTADGLVGRGGWSWYTGSASWLYRIWIEEVLGLRVEGDHFCVNPCLPADWTTYSFTYRPRGATYHILVTNDGKGEESEVSLDARPLQDRRIPLILDSGAHAVVVRTVRQKRSVAEGVGFEPTVESPLRRFSRPVP